MPDHGREVKFGYFLVPDAGEPLIAAAQEAERLGLDYVAVQDHAYQRRFVDMGAVLPRRTDADSRVVGAARRGRCRRRA